MDCLSIAQAAKKCAPTLANASTQQKNAALLRMAELLDAHRTDLVAANQVDVTAAKDAGKPAHLVARLLWPNEKIDARIRALHKIAALPDPVGEFFEPIACANGLKAFKMRVPLGVILMVYEARLHVTVNAGAFCLKSGNAVILRGGSEAKTCNQLLGKLWQKALSDADLPTDAIQMVIGSHEQVHEFLQLSEEIDLAIPRGGTRLIEAVTAASKIPLLKHYNGLCHVYIDAGADLAQALDIAIDSKCLMPEVCNSMETLLVHRAFTPELDKIVAEFRANDVKVKGCPVVCTAVPDVDAATEADWRTEYLQLVVSIRVVDSLEAAISHINHFGSQHTDTIVTDSYHRADRFVKEVDSSVVLVNASTMFNDGATLGMGAEIGIATGKLHERGPVGLQGLTSYKFVIRGSGQIMGEAGIP
ncbi:glutamate-5-semialdehyde dehydrogenase [Coleofasciculus sp. F4-SAH-05]|jgi:glutamate-5-semialdehyde dehydrogenase|uniref:glutamate-5-semialdehyde dehydrogenase n=1 Tax=Coleofasciculus TaxID=669368 RepID=UPI0032F44DE9